MLVLALIMFPLGLEVCSGHLSGHVCPGSRSDPFRLGTEPRFRLPALPSETRARADAYGHKGDPGMRIQPEGRHPNLAQVQTASGSRGGRVPSDLPILDHNGYSIKIQDQ